MVLSGADPAQNDLHGLFTRLIVMRRGQAEVLAAVGGEQEESEEAAAPAADADE